MIQFFSSTHAGLVRGTNQDCYSCDTLSENLAYAVLCDGMGGKNGGNIASEMATSFTAGMLRRDLREDMTPTALRSVIQSAIAGANALVYERSVQTPELKGMGTTLIVAVAWQDTLHVGYVGDSRVYCVSPGSERQLTKDHTVVQMLLDIGEISEKDAESHPKRHYITRAVGVGAEVDADYLEHTLGPDEIILLCSDGMYQYLTPGSLYPLLAQCVQEQSADSLIAYANAAGGADNITAVVLLRQNA